MHIPSIRSLVEANHSIETLQAAEEAIIEEQALSIEVGGADEGEQLTHILAAIFIQEKMTTDGLEFKKALREYTGKVRQSIS